MKSILNKIIIVLIMCICISMVSSNILVTVSTASTASYTAPVIEPSDPGVASDIEGAGSKVAGLISVIAACVAIAILIWLSIKYMTAAPSEKADIKKSAVTYVIGAVLLFAASGILGVISSFASGLFGTSGGAAGGTSPSTQGTRPGESQLSPD